MSIEFYYVWSRKTSASLTMLKPLTVWITTNCGKFFKRWEYQTLICLLRNLYAGQEATVRTGHWTTDWVKIGKGVRQGCILSPCLFNHMQNIWCEVLDWMKSKLESRLLGEISTTLICRWHHPYGRKWRVTQELLDEGDKAEWKS